MTSMRTGRSPGTGAVVVRGTRDWSRWDALVHRFPTATAFHTSTWLRSQTALHGWRFEALLAQVDGRPVGVVPVLLGRRPGGARTPPVPFPYLGPLVPPEHLPAVLHAVERWGRRHLVVKLQFAFGPVDGPPPDDLAGPARDVGSVETMAIDLSHGSFEEFLRRARKQARQGLRRAATAGVVVAPATAEQVRAWLPRLLREAFEHRGLASPYPADVGSVVWSAYSGGQDALFLAATVDGEPGGLLVVVREGRVAYDWAGGGFRAHRDAAPNTLLHVEAVRWALGLGCDRYDLVGSVDAGVVQFKKTLGADSERFTEVRLHPFPAARRAHRVVRALQAHGRG